MPNKWDEQHFSCFWGDRLANKLGLVFNGVASWAGGSAWRVWWKVASSCVTQLCREGWVASIITQLSLEAIHHLSLPAMSMQTHQRAQGFRTPGMECTRIPLVLPEILVLASPPFVLELFWIRVLLLKIKRILVRVVCHVSPKTFCTKQYGGKRWEKN